MVNCMRKYLCGSVCLLLMVIMSQSCKVQRQGGDRTIHQAMLKAMRWQEAHPIAAKAPTDWTNGAYYAGIVKAHEATGDTAFLETLRRMARRNAWKPWERYYHADDIIITYAYMYLKQQGDVDADLGPTDVIIKDHLYKPHVWRAGTEKTEKKILWWWCDALFMAPPVLAKYAKMKADNSLITEMDKYYRQTYDLLYDRNDRLFARDGRFLWTGSDADLKEQNGKKVFWSRGNGWVLAGLALTLDELPEGHPSRAFYVDLFIEMADRIKGLQHEDGLWRTSLLHPESFPHGEVSGSGFFTFALAWGINKGLLQKSDYGSSVQKAWKALLKCQQEDGKVGWVQNIGYDPKPATADSWQNFGTGAFIMAASEVSKLK